MLRRSFTIGTTGSLLAAVAIAACDSPGPTASTETPVKAGIATEASAAANPKASSYEIRVDSLNVAPGFTGIVEVYCTAGKRALGGGYKILGGIMIEGADVAVYESTPRVTNGVSGWRLEAANRTTDSRFFQAWVICAAI